MPELQVKKVVAVCFLEAAKLTLEHLGAHRLELSQSGATGRDDLPRLYGDVRRLRDYLQRAASSYQDIVVLDLSNEDAANLVACCRRAVEAIEFQLEERANTPEQRCWLERKLQVLANWAVEVAVKPLVDLGLPRMLNRPSEVVRALDGRISDKIFGDVNKRKKYAGAPDSNARMLSVSHGATTFGQEMAGAGSTRVDGDDDCGRLPSPFEYAETVEDDGEVAPVDEESAPRIGRPLFDPARLRDPRLRALVTIDMKGLSYAESNGDIRIAAVLLAAIAETMVLDHALTRRSELGLAGAPDKWNMQAVMLKAMGENCEPRDRALAFQLFAARNLLRPAVQMVTPSVVTPSSYEALREFVARAVHVLGFGAGAKTSPPDAVDAADLPTA